MPVLSNQKHERFAQAVASGLSASAAYVEAGYPKNDGNASRLKGSEKVRRRIDELLSESAERCGITIDRLTSELAKIAFYRADDFFSWGPEGVKIVDSKSLTPDQLSVVSEVQETKAKGHGESTIKVKLSDKQAAIDKLMRHLGAYKEKVEHSGSMEIKDVSPRERIAGRISQLASRVAKG